MRQHEQGRSTKRVARCGDGGAVRGASTRAYIWAIPVAVAALFHAPCLWGEFIWDAIRLIPEHPQLASPGFAGQLWLRDYGLEFARTPLGYYRPVFMSIVWMLRTLAGPSAPIFHLVSLLTFCLATAGVTRVADLSLRARSPLPAILVGTLYALHPARVEAVSLVMSLPDLLVECCALALILVMSGRGDRPRPLWGVAAAAFALAVVAGLAKENAFFIFPAIAVTLAACALRAPGPGSRDDAQGAACPPSRPAQWVAAGSVLLGIITVWGLRLGVGIQAPRRLPGSWLHALGAQAVPELRTLALGCRELILPGPTVFWRLIPAHPAGLGAPLLLLVVLATCAWLWWRSLRCRDVRVPLLTGWLGGSMVSLLMLAASGYPYSQRYLAVAPAVILLGIAAWRVVDGWCARRGPGRQASPWRRVTVIALVAYLGVHGAYALQGTLTCLTQTGFFTVLCERNPHDVIPWGAKAECYQREGRPARDVEACVRRAGELGPDHNQLPALHDMLIKCYLDEQAFGDALRIADGSLGLFPRDSAKMALRAVALASLGRFDEAVAQIDAAIVIAPTRDAYRRLRAEMLANRQGNQASPAPARP